MTALTDEIKEFIVKSLACYDTPTRIADAVNAQFGVTVSRQQVYRYDPECSEPPSQRWRDLHAATRQAFLRGTAEISVTHKVVRLRMLDRLAHRCERNSVALALTCLQQAAKECGGMYENRRPVMVQVSVPQQPASPISLDARPNALIESTPLPQLPDLSEPQPLNANQQ